MEAATPQGAADGRNLQDDDLSRWLAVQHNVEVLSTMSCRLSKNLLVYEFPPRVIPPARPAWNTHRSLLLESTQRYTGTYANYLSLCFEPPLTAKSCQPITLVVVWSHPSLCSPASSVLLTVYPPRVSRSPSLGIWTMTYPTTCHLDDNRRIAASLLHEMVDNPNWPFILRRGLEGR